MTFENWLEFELDGSDVDSFPSLSMSCTLRWGQDVQGDADNHQEEFREWPSVTTPETSRRATGCTAGSVTFLTVGSKPCLKASKKTWIPLSHGAARDLLRAGWNMYKSRKKGPQGNSGL